MPGAPEISTSAPAERNKQPILDELRPLLPTRGKVLEIASGTGQHVVHFAAGLPDFQWQPSDREATEFPAIEARRELAGIGNVVAPVLLDVLRVPWSVDTDFDAVLCINMIHISPWPATLGLMRGAARWLAPGAPLFLYGPFMREGRHTAPSNAAFDADLRARDPRWGVRELETVTNTAREHGLVLDEVVEMPAKNLSVVLRRDPG